MNGQKFLVLSIAVLVGLVVFTDGATTRITNCGNAIVGESLVLTCNITGPINNGIKWFRDDKINSVISCTTSRNCLFNAQLYDLTTPHNPTQMSFTILNVTQDDILNPWICIDGSNRTAATTDETCRIMGPQESTASPPTTVEVNEKDNGGLSGGAIAGIVIGVVVPATAICCIVFFIMKKKKQKKQREI